MDARRAGESQLPNLLLSKFGLTMQPHGASHVALLKSPPANSGDRRDTCLIPGWARAPEEGMVTPSSILVRRIPMKSSLVGYNPQGLKELDATEAAEHRGTHMQLHRLCLSHPSCSRWQKYSGGNGLSRGIRQGPDRQRACMAGLQQKRFHMRASYKVVGKVKE